MLLGGVCVGDIVKTDDRGVLNSVFCQKLCRLSKNPKAWAQPIQHSADTQSGQRCHKWKRANNAGLMRPVAVARQHVRQNHHSQAPQQDERKALAKVNQADDHARQKAVKKQWRKQRLFDLVILAVPHPAQRQPVFVQLVQQRASQSQLRVKRVLCNTGLAGAREKSCRIARVPNNLRYQQCKRCQQKCTATRNAVASGHNG